MRDVDEYDRKLDGLQAAIFALFRMHKITMHDGLAVLLSATFLTMRLMGMDRATMLAMVADCWDHANEVCDQPKGPHYDA